MPVSLHTNNVCLFVSEESEESSSEESDEEEKEVGLVGQKRKALQQSPAKMPAKKAKMINDNENASNGESKWMEGIAGVGNSFVGLWEVIGCICIQCFQLKEVACKKN